MQESAGTSAGAVEKRRMADSNQVRINELARELEIKAKVLIDYLPEAGVTEKKTHSSSIDLKHAELVRKHFRGLAAAEEAEAAEKAAKATAAKKPAAKPAVAAPAAPTAVGAKPAAGGVAPAAPATAAARPGVATHAPAAGPATAPGRCTPCRARRRDGSSSDDTSDWRSTRGCETCCTRTSGSCFRYCCTSRRRARCVRAASRHAPAACSSTGKRACGSTSCGGRARDSASSWRTVNFATLSGTSGSAWFCAGTITSRSAARHAPGWRSSATVSSEQRAAGPSWWCARAASGWTAFSVSAAPRQRRWSGWPR